MSGELKKAQNPKRLWFLTVKNLKTMFRDRVQWVWLLGYPLLFIVVFSVAFGEGAYAVMAPALVLSGPPVLISQLASHFAEENELGTIRRLATTPVSRRSILLSGMVSQLVVGSIQIVLLLVLSLAFGAFFHPQANIGLLFLIPFLFCFTSLGFGLLLASFVKTANSAGGLAWFLILPLQFLGGVFAQDPVITVLPTSFAVNAMRQVMTNGVSSLGVIGLDLIGIIIWGVGTTILGIILFQRKSAIL
ncbi:MAG: ABC transporter permease [bacterium]|nr:MAG: ABC transporter permease [bacterium]